MQQARRVTGRQTGNAMELGDESVATETRKNDSDGCWKVNDSESYWKAEIGQGPRAYSRA